MIVAERSGTIKSNNQATEYAAQKAAVRFVSRHERRRTICLKAPIIPMPMVMYSRSMFARNLSGENSSSSAMLRSKLPGTGYGYSCQTESCKLPELPEWVTLYKTHLDVIHLLVKPPHEYP